MRRFAKVVCTFLLSIGTLAVSEAGAQGKLPVPPATSPAGTTSPAAGSQIHTVQVGVNGEGRFEPAELRVQQGDVIRFVAQFGVHNIHFAAEQNPGKPLLPAASPYLLRAGDTYEMKVDFAPGTYHFQCDPHAQMKMTGVLKVEPAEG